MYYVPVFVNSPKPIQRRTTTIRRPNKTRNGSHRSLKITHYSFHQKSQKHQRCLAWTSLPTAISVSSPILEWPHLKTCLLYTSDAADERSSVDLGGRRIIKK